MNRQENTVAVPERQSRPRLTTISHRRIPIALATSLLVFGCVEKSTDLGRNQEYNPVYAKGAPPSALDSSTLPTQALWKLIEDETTIFSFAVNQGQALWLSITNRDFGQLNRCDVTSCKGSYKRLVSWTNRDSSPQVVLTETNLYLNFPNVPGLSGCSSSECSNRTGLSTNSDLGDLSDLYIVASDAESLLLESFSSSGLFYCKLPDCKGTAVTLPSLVRPDGADLHANAYAIDETFAYFGDDEGIYRVKLATTGELEPVALGQVHTGRIALHGDSVFWTESIAAGSVKTCPKTGCVKTPKQLMVNLNHPFDLVIDDRFIYTLEPCTSNTGGIHDSSSRDEMHDRLLRCSIAGCDTPTVLTENTGAVGNLTQDTDYVYFSGSTGCNCVGDDRTNSCNSLGWVPRSYDNYIAVIPK